MTKTKIVASNLRLQTTGSDIALVNLAIDGVLQIEDARICTDGKLRWLEMPMVHYTTRQGRAAVKRAISLPPEIHNEAQAAALALIEQVGNSAA